MARGRSRTGEVNLDALADVTQGLEVWFPAPLGVEHQRLMDTLGVRVHVDPPGTSRDDR